MRFFLISDNSDAMNGLRLAGIEGIVARSAADVRSALEKISGTPDIGMILVTEKIADTYQSILDEARQVQTGPLLVTPPLDGILRSITVEELVAKGPAHGLDVRFGPGDGQRAPRARGWGGGGRLRAYRFRPGRWTMTPSSRRTSITSKPLGAGRATTC